MKGTAVYTPTGERIKVGVPCKGPLGQREGYHHTEFGIVHDSLLRFDKIERTELREQFFAEAKTDPWTHMISTLAAQAWADGYEKALKDNGLDEARLRRTHRERVNAALEEMTSEKNKAQAETIMALSSLGKITDERRIQ